MSCCEGVQAPTLVPGVLGRPLCPSVGESRPLPWSLECWRDPCVLLWGSQGPYLGPWSVGETSVSCCGGVQAPTLVPGVFGRPLCPAVGESPVSCYGGVPAPTLVPGVFGRPLPWSLECWGDPCLGPWSVGETPVSYGGVRAPTLASGVLRRLW